MDSLEPASSMPSSSASPGISSDNYDDLTSAEDFSFPWKQREILTFDIPVHDSERAGLGVSVNMLSAYPVRLLGAAQEESVCLL